MSRFTRAALGWLVLIATLSGCGQKGDLYLPSESARPNLTLQQDIDFAS
ncbi:LPS translocon maturation chaperone LptM [Saccharospirillum mangrovi]|nr:lipoprotein [Saccharospirillum mangrovi]